MPPNKISSFHSFFETSAPTARTLPLTHTTDGWVFEEHLLNNKRQLDTTKCSFLGDEILYLFYGRPTYRVNSKVESTDQEAFHSICFLIDGGAAPSLRNIFPFDTGAFLTEKYKEHLHPRMALDDFALGSDIGIAAKIVERLYGSNINYFMGRVKADFDRSGAPMAVQSYHSLVSSRATSTTDARRSSIEIQSLASIDVRTAKILAVILPEQMLDQPDIHDFIKFDLRAKGIGYFCIHASPREDMALIMKEARDFYKKKRLL